MNDQLLHDAVLKIGEVYAIDGRIVFAEVYKNKNVSDLLFNGSIIKNISVGGYVEIRKGFLSIIGKVEGEKIIEHTDFIKNNYQIKDNNKRILSIRLCGYINNKGRFVGGIKELPLIANDVYLLTDGKIHLIHNLLKRDDVLKISVAKTDIEEIRMDFPIDGLFNSHIAIFGNTGSGKSNTLASLYNHLILELSKTALFRENCKFLFFDFNGEYIKKNCISKEKQVYNLSTGKGKDKIPMDFNDLMSIENMSILFEATEKTQRPFLNRALKLFKNTKNKDKASDYCQHFINILKKKTKEALLMANKDLAYRILDYTEEILSYFYDALNINFREDIEFHNTSSCFMLISGQGKKYLNSDPDASEDTIIYKYINEITESKLSNLSELNQYFIFILLQLIYDLTSYKIQIDHILPVINRFKSKRADIDKIFAIDTDANLWKNSNIIIVNLSKVNIDMRKTIPLLVAKHIYGEHKNENNTKSLSIIIDEAHNILSKTSSRETEDWKDYRLETFEEIIKEGRKFGVFVTISSQRPNDISETIISQAHNYFIHQLVNERDLQTIGNAVSYIDKITEESIPTLPVGTCIFSGVATPMPLKIKIDELPDMKKPKSYTLKYENITTEIDF